MAGWLDVFLRTVGSIVVLFFLTRMNGKRQISQLNIFEYITGITVGSIAAFISADMEGKYFVGLLSMALWMLIPLGLSWLTLKSKKLRDLVDDKGVILIKQGKVLEDNLSRVRYSADELLEQLRQKNAFSVADVEFAVLEPNGNVSVLLRTDKQPITPAHLAWTVPTQREPAAVIMDGKILDESLATVGWSPGRLHAELEKINVTLENVFLGQVDSRGGLYVDLYDDRIQTPPAQEHKILLSLLRKCQADFELYALSTENQAAKATFALAARKLQTSLQLTEPLLDRT